MQAGHLRRRAVPGKHLLSSSVKLKEPTTLTHLEPFIMSLIETQVQTHTREATAQPTPPTVTVPPMDEFNRAWSLTCTRRSTKTRAPRGAITW